VTYLKYFIFLLIFVLFTSFVSANFANNSDFSGEIYVQTGSNASNADFSGYVEMNIIWVNYTNLTSGITVEEEEEETGGGVQQPPEYLVCPNGTMMYNGECIEVVVVELNYWQKMGNHFKQIGSSIAGPNVNPAVGWVIFIVAVCVIIITPIYIKRRLLQKENEK